VKGINNYMKYTEDVKEKVFKLREDGLSNLKISKILSINRNTILSWVNPKFKDKKNKSQMRNYFKYRDKKLIKMRNFVAENKEHLSVYNKMYHEKNKEKINAKKRAYRLNNKEYVRIKRSNNHKIRIHKDINYYLSLRLRSRFKEIIKKCGLNKTDSAMSMLGCSLEYFKSHIESKFTDGMTWENKGKFGWHIDHIKPLCTFDLTDIEQQKKAFHYTNLQPLWWDKNLAKGRKYYAESL